MTGAANREPIDAEYEVINGPLPSTEVVPPSPADDGAWASREEIVGHLSRWVGAAVVMALAYAAMLAYRTMTGH